MIDDPVSLAARRGNRSDVFFQHLAAAGSFQALIEHCLPRRHLDGDVSTISNHDDRAAFVCALSALCVAASDFVAVGDNDGWIILPPRSFIRPAQWSLLQINALEEGEGSRHMFAQWAPPDHPCSLLSCLYYFLFG
jgi:hypothetical protein